MHAAPQWPQVQQTLRTNLERFRDLVESQVGELANTIVEMAEEAAGPKLPV